MEKIDGEFNTKLENWREQQRAKLQMFNTQKQANEEQVKSDMELFKRTVLTTLDLKIKSLQSQKEAKQKLFD